MWGRDEKTGTDSVFRTQPPCCRVLSFKMDVYLTIVDVDDER